MDKMETIHLLPIDEYSPEVSKNRRYLQRVKPTKDTMSKVAFILSMMINLYFACLIFWHNRFVLSNKMIVEEVETKFAGLKYDVPTPFMEHSEYSDGDLDTVRALWDDISIDDGTLALSDEYAASLDLPPAQRFPWDNSKGIYFINAFHNLHCLRAVHISLMEFAYGEPQTRNFGHIRHCMDTLRQDIICNADDTPRYTTEDASPESGMGQMRQCRNWDKMVEWSRQHNACYKFINQTAHEFPNVLRYTYCPDGSPYKDTVLRAMGGLNMTDL